MHRPLTPWRLLAFAYLNLCVVSVRQHLVERAHAELLPAARTLHEMVGFRFKHAIRVNPTILAGLRHRSRASFLYRQPTRGGSNSALLPARYIGRGDSVGLQRNCLFQLFA